MSNNSKLRAVWTSEMAADFAAFHGNKDPHPGYPVEDFSPMRKTKFDIGDIIYNAFNGGSHYLVEGFHYHNLHRLWMYDLRRLESDNVEKDYVQAIDTDSWYQKVA